jgi:hypothetical protein
LKLRDLIKLREASETNHEQMAMPFLREFHTRYGYNVNFKFLGMKDEECIYVAPMSDLGMFEMIVSDAKIYAKITEKSAIFGIVYTLTGLEKFEATISAMKQKDGVVETILFDNSDKKTFSDKATDFLGIEKEG